MGLKRAGPRPSGISATALEITTYRRDESEEGWQRGVEADGSKEGQLSASVSDAKVRNELKSNAVPSSFAYAPNYQP